MTATTTEQPQHLQALEHANAVRLDQARFKATLKADSSLNAPLRVAYALCLPEDERPEWLNRFRLDKLIGACPRWGVRRTTGLLADLGIPERKRVGDATVRQRQALAAALDRAVTGEGDPRHRLTLAERRAFEKKLKAEGIG